MMTDVVEEGTGTPAQLGRDPRRGQDRHGPGRPDRVEPDRRLVHRLRAGRGSEGRRRGRARGRPGRLRRDRRGADRGAGDQDCCWRRGSDGMSEPDAQHADRRALQGAVEARLRRHGGRVPGRGRAAVAQGRAEAAARAVRRPIPDFVERFRREAQAAAGLQHPNVVSVYDRGKYEDTYYIAMEYLPGRSLKQLIREEAPLDPVRAIDITIQILKAARFAHRRGVIHRDLKPHNVIVDDADQAKVTDFGIARAGASDMTETGSIMGTAQYLSPEQAQGLRRRRGLRPLLDRRRAVRDAHRAGAVRRRRRGHDRAQARLRGARRRPAGSTRRCRPSSSRSSSGCSTRTRADRPADADQLITALEHAGRRSSRRPPARTPPGWRRSPRSQPPAPAVAARWARSCRPTRRTPSRAPTAPAPATSASDATAIPGCRG